jgi:hypothetical protein
MNPMTCKHEYMMSGYCQFCGTFGFDADRLFFKEGVKMKDPYGWEMDAKSDTDASKNYEPKSDPYEKLGLSIGNMVAEKQLAYGDSFGRAGQVLKILYPDGIILDQYDDMLAVVRIIDKLFRVANNKDAFGESPFRDIAGYGILGAFKSELSK